MGLRNGQWPKQDANLGHEILAPAVGFDEIWMAGWLAFARENGMRAAVRLGFLEKGSLARQGGIPCLVRLLPCHCSFIPAGSFSGAGKRASFQRLTQRAGVEWIACQAGSVAKVLPRAKRQGKAGHGRTT